MKTRGMASQDTLPSDVRLMQELYGWLREEIRQSYQIQYQIAIGQATLVAVATGLQFGLKLQGKPLSNPTLFSLLLNIIFIALPWIVIVTAGMWLLEHCRVMRAGNYLQLLEHRINKRVPGYPLHWETWLRDPHSPSTRWQKLRDPHVVYDIAFTIAYPMFFLLLGVVSLALVQLSVFSTPIEGVLSLNTFTPPFQAQRLGIALYLISASFAILSTTVLLLLQIKHQKQDRSTEPKKFDDWCKKRFGSPRNDPTTVKRDLEESWLVSESMYRQKEPSAS